MRADQATNATQPEPDFTNYLYTIRSTSSSTAQKLLSYLKTPGEIQDLANKLTNFSFEDDLLVIPKCKQHGIHDLAGTFPTTTTPSKTPHYAILFCEDNLTAVLRNPLETTNHPQDNRLPTTVNLRQILAHELVHLYDLRVNRMNLQENLESLKLSEMRAYEFMGVCKSQTSYKIVETAHSNENHARASCISAWILGSLGHLNKSTESERERKELVLEYLRREDTLLEDVRE